MTEEFDEFDEFDEFEDVEEEEEVDDEAIDSFVLNLEEQEIRGFEPLPSGWYRVMVDGWSEEYGNGNPIAIKKEDGEIPKGTKGTGWQLNVVDDSDYEGRVLFNNMWHHPSSGGFWKAFYKATGVFSEEELSKPMDILAQRDRIVDVGAEMYCRVKVRKATEQYDASNKIVGFMSTEEYEEKHDF